MAASLSRCKFRNKTFYRWNTRSFLLWINRRSQICFTNYVKNKKHQVRLEPPEACLCDTQENTHVFIDKAWFRKLIIFKLHNVSSVLYRRPGDNFIDIFSKEKWLLGAPKGNLCWRVCAFKDSSSMLPRLGEAYKLGKPAHQAPTYYLQMARPLMYYSVQYALSFDGRFRVIVFEFLVENI